MIYFIQSADGGPVKIGTTKNLEARLKQLEEHYGCPLAVLATMPGGQPEEAAIHARFDHLRFKRSGRGRDWEQFRPAADLMAFIGRPLLVGSNPDATEVMLPAYWKPFELRYKSSLTVSEPKRRAKYPPLQAAPRPGAVPVQVKLDPAERDVLDGIVKQLARTGYIATQSNALRWAIAELTAQLREAARPGAADLVCEVTGPMTSPPE